MKLQQSQQLELNNSEVNKWKMVWIVRPQDLHTDLNLSDKTVVRRWCGWLWAGSVVMSELCHTTWAVMVCGLSAFVRFIQLTEYLQTAEQHSRRMWPDPLWQTDTELHFSMGHLAQWDLQTLSPERGYYRALVRQNSSNWKSSFTCMFSIKSSSHSVIWTHYNMLGYRLCCNLRSQNCSTSSILLHTDACFCTHVVSAAAGLKRDIVSQLGQLLQWWYLSGCWPASLKHETQQKTKPLDYHKGEQ